MAYNNVKVKQRQIAQNQQTKELGIVSPVPMGDWSSTIQYKKLNIVRYSGVSYMAKSDNVGVSPYGNPQSMKIWQRVAADGRSIIVGSETTYQAGESGQIPPTGEWSETIPIVAAGSYLWNKIVLLYDDETSTTTYVVARQGVDGKEGEIGKTGNGIKNYVIEYAVSTSGKEIPADSEWETEIPVVQKGQYLWTRTTLNYTDDTNSFSYSVAYQGTDGAMGNTGYGIYDDGLTSTSTIGTESINVSNAQLTHSISVGDFEIVKFNSVIGNEFALYKVTRVTPVSGGINRYSLQLSFISRLSGTNGTRIFNSITGSFDNQTIANVPFSRLRPTSIMPPLVGDFISDGKGTWTRIISVDTSGEIVQAEPFGVMRGSGYFITNESIAKWSDGTSKTFNYGNVILFSPLKVGDIIVSKTTGVAVAVNALDMSSNIYSATFLMETFGVGITSITPNGTDANGGNIYKITLSDGTSYNITAPKGTDGAPGKDGTDGISALTYSSTYSTTSNPAPGSTLSNISIINFNRTPIVEDKYTLLWRNLETNHTFYCNAEIASVDSATNRATATIMSVVDITGQAAYVVSESRNYVSSTDGANPPAESANWSASASPVQGQYLWSRNILTFNNGSTSTLYAVAYQGVDGTGSGGAAEKSIVALTFRTYYSYQSYSYNQTCTIRWVVDRIPQSQGQIPSMSNLTTFLQNRGVFNRPIVSVSTQDYSLPSTASYSSVLKNLLLITGTSSNDLVVRFYSGTSTSVAIATNNITLSFPVAVAISDM